jgi:hypothetical protein
MVPREKVEMYSNNLKDSPRSTLLEIPGIPRHFNIGFDQGDLRVATLIVYAIDKERTQHQHWLVDCVADMISTAIFNRYGTVFNLRNYFRISAASALLHGNVDSSLLNSSLLRLGWHPKDDYQIALVSLPQENRKISHFLYNYENIFAGAFSDCIAMHFDEYILILLHGNACDALTDCLPTLEKQLTMDDAICSIGSRFCDFSQLHTQYNLTLFPFHFYPHNHRIRVFRSVLFAHTTRELSSIMPLRAICHYAAIRVNEYDNLNGTDYLLTLETYLLNNKSLIASANSLFIHRSTMTYRLKCIKNIVNISFEDAEDRLCILLSCMILRVLNTSGQFM